MVCSVHVASVLQMAHMLLTHGGIRQSNAMGMQEVYGTYWSAITHDFEHGGLNNDFLVCNNDFLICNNDFLVCNNDLLVCNTFSAGFRA